MGEEHVQGCGHHPIGCAVLLPSASGPLESAAGAASAAAAALSAAAPPADKRSAKSSRAIRGIQQLPRYPLHALHLVRLPRGWAGGRHGASTSLGPSWSHTSRSEENLRYSVGRSHSLKLSANPRTVRGPSDESESVRIRAAPKQYPGWSPTAPRLAPTATQSKNSMLFDA